MSKNNIHNLESLQKRKTELAALCKTKEQEIAGQVDYIGEHLGSIAIRTFINAKDKSGSTTKSEIITLLVSEGIETAMNIQQDPTHVKDKVVGFIKKSAAGVINLIVK